LVHWTRIAYAKDSKVNLESIDLSDVTTSGNPTAEVQSRKSVTEPVDSGVRDELRRLILEELQNLKGDAQ